MKFLNPALLSGIGLVAVPIIIHLINRRRYRTIEWAAVDFLLNALQRRTRRLQLQDLILLLLRIALLALLVLALSRFTVPTTAAKGPSGSGTNIMLILDRSMSMGYQVGGKTRLDAAKQRAFEILEQSEQGSAIAVATLPDSTATRAFFRTFDPLLAKELVERADVSYEAFAVDQTVRQALEYLQNSELDGWEVYLLSDFQEVDWREAYQEVAGLSEELDKLGKFFFVSVNSGQNQNVALTELTLGDALLDTQGVTTFTARLENKGAYPVEALPVQIKIDGRLSGSKDVSLQPNESKSVWFQQRLKPGDAYQEIQVEAQPDGLPGDDKRHLVVRVSSGKPVLIIDGNPSTEPVSSESSFLSFALSPDFSDEEGEFVLPFKPIVRTVDTLEASDLVEYECVILANVAAVTKASASLLHKHLSEGGGILVFMGELIDAHFYNQFILQSEGESLGELGRILQEDQVEGGLKLQKPSSSHPVFANLLHEDADLLQIRFSKAFQFKAPEVQSYTPILNFSSGLPFLSEFSIGRGRMLIFNTTATPDWSTLPLKPLFLPLLYRSIHYAIAGRLDDTRSSTVGEPLIRNLKSASEGQTFNVRSPGDEATSTTSPRPSSAGGYSIRWDRTQLPGFYHMVNAAEGFEDKFAVNPLAAESSLMPAFRTDVERWVPNLDFQYVEPGAPLNETISDVRTGRELWKLALGMVILITLAEPFLAARFTGRKSGEA